MDKEGGSGYRLPFLIQMEWILHLLKRYHTSRKQYLLQSNDLETVKENLTEWFDSERKTKMEQFDKDQSAGAAKYVVNGKHCYSSV